MAVQQQTSLQYFKSLNILHYALAAGQILFGVIAFIFQKTTSIIINDPSVLNGLRLAVPLIAIVSVVSGGLLYKKQVSDIRNKYNLSHKLNAYRSIVITRDVLFQFPSLLAVISFMLTGEMLFLALTGSLITLFVYVRPAKERVIRDLQLSSEETNLVNDDYSIVAEIEVKDDK